MSSETMVSVDHRSQQVAPNTVNDKKSSKISGITSSKIWDYFKQSDNNQNRAMCLICSKELCHMFNNNDKSISGQIVTPKDKSDNNNNVLWNHLKTEHSIHKTIREVSNTQSIDRPNGSVHKTKTLSTETLIKSVQTNNRSTSDALKKSAISTTQRKLLNNEHTDQSVMTTSATIKSRHNHKHNKHKEQSSASTTKSINTQGIDCKLRKSLDLMDYEDILQLRMKPSANSRTSLSKNLISRLNELSSPVARKLKFWNKKSFQVNQYDPSFKVIYLGNLGMQFLSKDEQCLEKPLNTLWNNYLVYMKTEIVMRLTICNSGLKAITRQHGLTQYWSNRLVYCFTHKNYPKIFSWIYRHEGKKMRQELRCHAVFCSSPEKASKMVSLLNQRLACALQEFRREKKSREPPSIMTKSDRINNLDSIYLLQQTLPRTVPLRRQILAKGSANFRPSLDRSKSAPKLTSIREEEDYDEEEEEEEEEDDDEESEEDDDDAQSSGTSVSQEEFEFEQSFGDRGDSGEDDDDDDDDEDGYHQYDEEELKKLVDNLNIDNLTDDDNQRIQKIESDSMMSTVQEVTSNSSSACATGDNSFDINSLDRSHLHPGGGDDSLNRQAFDRFSSPRLSRRSSKQSTSSRRTGRLDSLSETTTTTSQQRQEFLRNADKSDSLRPLIKSCQNESDLTISVEAEQQQQKQISANNQLHAKSDSPGSNEDGEQQQQFAAPESTSDTKKPQARKQDEVAEETNASELH